MKHTYISPLLGEGTEASPQEPAILSVYAGTFSSRPADDEDHILIIADTTDEQHAAILGVDGVKEV